MKPTLSATLLALTALTLGSCAIPDGERFDAYHDPAAQLGVGPDFQVMEINDEVVSDLLRPPTAPYRLGPGDRLDIEVAEDPRTQASTTVMPDGMLYFDVADGIQVKGKTLKEVSALLSKALEVDYPNAVVTVNLSEAQSQRFWVLGQVKQPGSYPIGRPTRLIEAISEAGGMYTDIELGGEAQETVDLDRAILIRDGELIPVNFRNLIEHGDMSQNVFVQESDYIYLPSVQHRAVYVLGAVRNPGPIYFDNDPTVLSAVAMAGGPRDEAVITKALVIRGSLNKPRVAVVNIRNIMHGRDNDAHLVGGDIVWVPDTVWTDLQFYVRGAIVTAAQAVAIQEGLGVAGRGSDSNVTINAGGGR